jgi:hypothetical protein
VIGRTVRTCATALLLALLMGMVLAAAGTMTQHLGGPPRPAPTRLVSGAAVNNTVVQVDTLGFPVDAHDGDLLEVGSWVYLYGTSYSCGFTIAAPSDYCGVKVYKSKDLQTWQPAGGVGGSYAFDHLTSSWQQTCAEHLGCYRPHVVRRPSDGRWVMWVNTHGGGGTDSGYVAMTSLTPGGPFTPTATRPVLAVDPADGGLEHGDFDITLDATGTGWIVYTVIRAVDNSHVLVIERLDPTLTTGTGEAVTVTGAGSLVEAPTLFQAPTGMWQLAFGPAAPYGVVPTLVMDAPSPLGPWTNRRTLQANSCSGQTAAVSVIRGTHVLITDRWVQTPTGGAPQQARATSYFGRLTFAANAGTAIDYHVCQPTWTLPPAGSTR